MAPRSSQAHWQPRDALAIFLGVLVQAIWKGTHGVIALSSQWEVCFGVPTGTSLQSAEWGGESDHHEGHQSASSMGPPTYCDYQHALPHIHFDGERSGILQQRIVVQIRQCMGQRLAISK
eukprot:2955715-Pyramimonas_sp.AAC.1